MVVFQVSVETNQLVQYIHFFNQFAVLEIEFLEVTRLQKEQNYYLIWDSIYADE